MFCKNCGSEIKEDQLFCSGCGKPISHKNNEIVQSKRKSSGKILVIVAILTTVLLVSVVIGLFFYHNYGMETLKDSEKVTEGTNEDEVVREAEHTEVDEKVSQREKDDADEETDTDDGGSDSEIDENVKTRIEESMVQSETVEAPDDEKTVEKEPSSPSATVQTIASQQSGSANLSPDDELFQPDEDMQFAPFYGIWCFASKDKDDARKQADKLISKGFDGRVFTTGEWGSLNEEVWYVVTAGVYSTESDAKNDLKAVHEAGFSDAYIKYTGDSIYVE